MFKKSFYNFELMSAEDDRIMLYNSRTNAFGIMDEDTKKVYDSVDEIDSNALENTSLKEKLNTLLNHGYIIPDEVNELDVLKLRTRIEKFNTDSLSFTIAPTMDCNMACPYCYEAGSAQSYMNESVQEVLYDFVIKSLEKCNSKRLGITWYGGEPLLAKDAILNLSKKFIEYCEASDIQYDSAIITNGYLLNNATARMLADDCKVKRAQITVDGLPEIHNTRRILKSGEKSFDTIVNNIADCKDILRIHVRVNVDNDNSHNLKDLWNYFTVEMGWGKNPTFMFAPVHDVSDCQHTLDEIPVLNDAQYRNVFEEYMQLFDGSDDIEMPIQMLMPRNIQAYCGAVRINNYVVDPDGDLYTCWEVIGRKDKTIGNIVNSSMNYQYINWLIHEPTESCYNCKFLPICSGGCPYRYLMNGSPQCSEIKLTLTARLKALHRYYLKKKECTNTGFQNDFSE